MFMRKIVTLVLLSIAIIATADSPKFLTLLADGDAKSYVISDIRKITFSKQSANSLEVYLKGESTIDTYSYSTLEKGVFEVESSGVESVVVDANELSITYNANSDEIQVVSSQDIATIMVYNLNGVAVKMLYPTSTEAVVPLADYSSGMYIVKVVTATTTQTQKIVKH